MTGHPTAARLGALLCAGVLGAAISACGSAAGAPVPPAAAQTATQGPGMIEFDLDDAGLHSTPPQLVHGRQVMVMVVNTGRTPQRLQVALPMTQVQVVDGASPVAPPIQSTASRLDITVAPGSETDAIFTPAAAGSFPLQVGTQSGVNLEVA